MTDEYNIMSPEQVAEIQKSNGILKSINRLTFYKKIDYNYRTLRRNPEPIIVI